MKLDMTLDQVQNSRFFHVYHDLIRERRYQHLNEMEVCLWLMVYHKFVLANGPTAKYMTKMQFKLFLEIYFNMCDIRIVERIIDVISFYDLVFDVRIVGPRAWLALYNVFTTNSLEEKMQFCFQVYDLRGQKILSRHTIELLISNFLIEDEDDMEDLKLDLLELLMQMFDHSKNGTISFEEYSEVVSKSPELLQFLGTCLPAKEHLETIFERLVFDLRASFFK